MIVRNIKFSNVQCNVNKLYTLYNMGFLFLYGQLMPPGDRLHKNFTTHTCTTSITRCTYILGKFPQFQLFKGCTLNIKLVKLTLKDLIAY